MKKICFFMENPFTLGGEQRVTSSLASYLAKKDYQVFFLLNSEKKYIQKNIKIDNNIEFLFLKNKSKITYKLKALFVKILKKVNYRYGLFKDNLKIQKWFYSINNNEIIEIINEKEFDYIIGVGSYFFSILANIKPKLRNTKIVSWQHSTFENYFKSKNKRLYNQNPFVKEIFSNSDYYICQTNSDKEKILKAYNYSATVINNPNTFINIKKRTNWPKNFIASGRFVKLKGFDKLVDAFNIFSNKNSEWKLYILGDGPELDRIQKKIKYYNLENKIILPGRVNNVEDYYINSSICLITSAWEGWCLVATEAMQYGLPIISFDLESLREIFGNTNCGYLVEQGNIHMLAQKMLELTTSNQFDNLSKNCIKQVSKFNIELIGKKWEEILK